MEKPSWNHVEGKVWPAFIRLARKTPHTVQEYLVFGEELLKWLKVNKNFIKQKRLTQKIIAEKIFKMELKKYQQRLYVAKWPEECRNYIWINSDSFSQTVLEYFADNNGQFYGTREVTCKRKRGKLKKKKQKYAKKNKILNTLKRHITKKPNVIRSHLPKINLQSAEAFFMEDRLREELSIKTQVYEGPKVIVLDCHTQEQLRRVVDKICQK